MVASFVLFRSLIQKVIKGVGLYEINTALYTFQEA